ECTVILIEKPVDGGRDIRVGRLDTMLEEPDVVVDVVAFVKINQELCRLADRREQITITVVEDARDPKNQRLRASLSGASDFHYVPAENFMDHIPGVIGLRRLGAQLKEPVAQALHVGIADESDVILWNVMGLGALEKQARPVWQEYPLRDRQMR